MAGYIGSKASVVSSGAERKKVFNITTSTTVLTGLSYTANQVHVFHNGVRLISGTDYTETNDTTITLTNAAENGDQVVVVSYASFQTSDTVSASAGGTFSNDVTVDGDLTVDTDTLHVDSANNRVGVGTSSPTTLGGGSKLTVNQAADGDIVFARGGSTRQVQLGTTSTTGYINADNTSGGLAFHVNTSERMHIDTSGRVTMPYQPAFLARLNTNWSHPSGAVQLGGTWVTDLNVGSHYSTSTRRFTAPVAGKYQFNTTVATEGSVSNIAYISSEIWVNGTRKYVGGWDSGGSSYNKSSASYVVDLNANDYVTIGSEISVSCNLTSNTHTTLSGYLIG